MVAGACTTENGMKGVYGKDYKCDQTNARGCPFEQDKMYGQVLCVAPGLIGACGGSPKDCTAQADANYQGSASELWYSDSDKYP